MEIRVTLAQLKPKLGDKKYNLEKICNTLEDASKNKSDLVVFPELFLTGYSVGKQANELAESINNSSVEEIKVVCRKNNINTVIGMVEKTKSGEFYIVSVFIDSTGVIRGVYKKTHLFDREKEYFSRGNDSMVIETPIGKIGLMICFDVEFPELARTLKLKGADYIIISNANMDPYKHHHYIYAKSRAMENEIPVIICNRVGEEEGLNFCGDSMVIDKNGNPLIQLDDKEMIKTTLFSWGEQSDVRLDYLENRNEKSYHID